MEREVTVARTNLADGETNVNRLRLPQLGIVGFDVCTVSKESKTYLQAGAGPAKTTGSDDFHFVPENETITIRYEIDDQTAVATSGTLQLFTRFKDKALWTVDLKTMGPTWLQHGKHLIKWDGRVFKALDLPGTVSAQKIEHDLTGVAVDETDAFPDGYVTLEHSPYKLKLTIESESPKKKVVAWTYFQILLKGIELAVGPAETIPKGWFGADKLKLDKEVRTQLETARLPAVGSTREVHLTSNIYKTDSAEMYDNTAFKKYKDMWKEGPRIPLLAKIRLASSSDAEVKLESDKGAVALGRARFLWEWEDPAEAMVNPAGSKPRAFVKAAIKYYNDGTDARSAAKDHTYPKGDNCHVDRGGKRGPDANPVFSPQSGYDPAATLEAEKFPFKVEACKERSWAVLSQPWRKGKLKGCTGVVFQPSRMAGDDYVVRVFLAWDKDKDGKYALDAKTEPLAADPRIQVETGTIQMFRQINIVRYLRKKTASIADFLATNLAGIQGPYGHAYVDVQDTRKPAQTYEVSTHCTKSGAALDYNAVAQKIIADSGDVLLKKFYVCEPSEDHAAVDSAWSFKAYPDFVRRVHTLLHAAAGSGDLAKLITASAPATATTVLKGFGTMALTDPSTLPSTAPDLDYHTRLWKTQQFLISNAVETEIKYSNTTLWMPSYDKLLNGMQCIAGGPAGGLGADDGITIVHFNGIHTVVRDLVAAGTAGVTSLDGVAADPKDGSRNKCVFVFFRSDLATFNHEVGHHLFLPHSKWHDGNGSVPGGPADNRHDDDDHQCIMSYSNTTPDFCGLCQLRLRGWDAEALDKDDATNTKP